MSIKSVFVRCHVGHVDLPLEKVAAFKGSDLTIGVLDVPKYRLGCEIKGVTVKVINAAEAAVNIAAVQVGNVWVATVGAAHFARSGAVRNGVKISLTGLDEAKVERTWVVSCGDLEILDQDGSVEPGKDYKILHWYSVAPLNPQPGDVAPIDGVAKVWSGSAWIDLGGGSSGGGAVVLTIVDGKLYAGGVEVATYNDLLALVRGGGVVLMGTVGAQKDALFYPLYCEDTAIRFDATGTLDSDVKNKSYTFQPLASGAIRISEGSVVDLAKKSDIPEGVTLDETVTETSENGVKSKGIWSFIKGLFGGGFTTSRKSTSKTVVVDVDSDATKIRFTKPISMTASDGSAYDVATKNDIADVVTAEDLNYHNNLPTAHAAMASQLKSLLGNGLAAYSFSAAKTYAVGDVVTKGGMVYRCKVAVETAGGWSDANWEYLPLAEIMRLSLAGKLDKTGGTLTGSLNIEGGGNTGVNAENFTASNAFMWKDKPFMQINVDGENKWNISSPSKSGEIATVGDIPSVVAPSLDPSDEDKGKAADAYFTSEELKKLSDRIDEGGTASDVCLTSPDGTKWTLSVNNDGTLSTTIKEDQN